MTTGLKLLRGAFRCLCKNVLMRGQWHLEQAFGEQDLYGLLQDGQQASVMNPYSPLQQRQHVFNLRKSRSTNREVSICCLFVCTVLVTVQSSPVHEITAIVTRERKNLPNLIVEKERHVVVAAPTVAVCPLTAITSTRLLLIMRLHTAGSDNRSAVFEPVLTLCVRLFTFRLS